MENEKENGIGEKREDLYKMNERAEIRHKGLSKKYVF